MQYITLQGNIFNVSEENLDAFLKKYPGAQLYTPEGEDDADLSSPRIKNPTIQDPKGGFYNVLGKTYQVHEHDYDAFVKKFGDDIQYLGKEDDTKTDQEIAIDQINSVKGDGYHFNQNESNTLKFLRASFGEYGFEFDGGTWGGDNWIIATGPDGSTQNFKTQFDGKDGLNQFNNFKRWASSRSNLKRKISKHEKNVIYHGAETNTDKIIEMDEETWREWFKEVLPLSGFQAEDSGSPGDAVDFILPNVGIMHSNLQPNFDGDNDLNRFFAISGSAKGERAIMQYILDVAKDRHANPHKYAVYTDFVGTQGGEGITLDDSVGISYLPKNFAALKKMYKTVGLDIKNVSGRGAPLYVIEKDGVEIFRGRNTPGTARITDYQNLSVGNENNFRGDGYKENLADFLFNYNFTQEEYDKLAVERQKIFKNRKNLSKGKGYSSTEKMLQHDMEDYQNIGKASTYLEITETKKLKDEIDKQAGALQIKIEKDQNILKKEMEDLAQQAKDEGITSVSYNETLGIYEVEGSNEEIVAKYSRLFNDHKQKVDLNRDLYNEAVDELMDKHQTILDQFEYLGEEAAALEKNYNWGNNMASRFQMGWKEITLGIGSIFGDKPAKRLQDLQAIQHNRYETLEWKGWDVEEGKWLTALSYMGAELTPTVLTTLVPGVAAMRGLGASVQAARWIYTGGAALQAIGSTSAEMRQAHMNVDEWKDQLKELDELHKKGKISDEVYNSTKVKLSELIIENDYSVAQSLSQVGLSGIIEGGFTYLMGANVFTKMFTPKYLGPGMSKIDDGLALLNKTNHKARMQFLGQTVFGMGTEVLEETLIYTFDQASRNVILDKEFNLDALPQVVYGSALMGGPMAGTGAFVQTVKTHALTKEMRTQWQDINRQIEENNLKIEKLGSDPKNQWKLDALITKGKNLRKQLGKVDSEIEAVALVLGKQNMGRLILAGRNLEDMAAKAGVDSHLSDAEKNKLIKKYVEAQMEEDPIAARKFMAEWNEALEIKNSIIGDVDFDGSIKKLFGLRGEEVLEKLMNIDPKLKDATEREKFLAVYDELKKDATARHIGASRSREDNNRWVEEQVYGEGGFKPPYKRNIKAENDYHELLGSVQEVDGVDAVMMYEAEEISTQKILRNKDLQNLTTVEAKTDEELEAAIRKAVDFAIERDLAEMRKTTPNEQDQQAKEAVIRAKANTLVFRLVDKLKTGKTNAFVVDDKYIVRDKKAGDAARKEGNLLAGTVLSHEISHAIDYLAFDQAGITNYGKLLYEYMEKNHPNIHAQAVAIQANIGNFNPFNNTFPKGEAKFYDEYSKEVQTALLYNKTEKAKLIKNHDVASGAWTRMMNKKEGFEITKPKHAAIYLASFLKGWERGEVGALQKRRIKYRKEKGLTSDIEGIKQSSNLQSMLDVDYEGDVKKMGRDAVSVDAQGKRLSIPDLTMSKLGQDIGAMVEDITKKLYDPILEKGELTRNEYKNALIGIASEIIRTENFDPTKQSLDKFVSSRLYLRANALAKQLGVPQEFLKDIANITDPTVDPDDDVDTKDEPVTKARVLNNFDIELEDGLVDAEIIAEVEALIEENPADLEARMERLILNDIRKKLDKTVGKIAKNKQTGKREPTPEYEVFIRNEYEEIVQSLGIKTIRTAYKTWFTQEKTGVKKYKNIREDGSVSNYVKATQINSTNKREYIRWFLEGKPGSLTERRTALLRRIARKKAEIAIDDYIERNSSNLDAVIDAKLRSLTRTAENIADEQASFDSIKFSENTKKKLKVYRLQTKKAADGSGRIIPRFQTAGHALEQVIIDQLVEWGWNLDLLDVEFMHTTNRGGLIDVILNVTDINTGKSRAVNMEVKMNKKVRMSSVLVSDYNLNYGDEQSFNLANDVYSDLSPYAEMLVNARESIMNLRNAYNRKIDAYNRKHGTKEPYLKYGGRMVDKIYHDPEIAKLRAAVRKNSYVFDDATPLIEHNLAKNVEIIEIFGMGLYSFEKNSSLTNPITGIGPKYIGETTAKVRAALGVKNTGRKRKQVEGVKTIIRNKAGDAYIDFRLQFQNTLINFKSTKENKSPISITNQQDVIGMFGIKQSQSGSLPFAAMKASENAKTPKKYHEQSRGMSTFDFDETLIIDGENFIVAKDPITGEKIKISSADWPIQGPRLAEQGYTFDFSDFVNVRGGVDGPLLQKMKNQIKKYGAKNVFVLTARPQSSAVAIHSWLKSKKINIPLENITGLGNSTGAAKAEWMLKKFAQGYNDMYFVDDALPNVEAVKDVLDQLDIKSNVQQARIKFSESLGVEFNKIIQQVTGIQAVIRFSDIQAKLRGAKTKYKSIVPPSAQDFVGLLYSFLGKGKQGEQQMEFFKKALLDPFNRGIDSLNASKRIAAVDYEKLLKKFPDVKKLLTKKIEGTPFTYDQAIRVYLWNKNGFSVPGLSIRDLNMLTSVIKNDPSLMEFAENIGFISKREEGYAAPTEYWLVENINSDLLSDGAIGDVRSKFLAEWIENKNAIFSPENLNKIEAIYGSKFREALEDMLFRMETGRSRPVGGGRIMNMYTNWVNNSVGAIMFFNIRSAVLQTISATNYINWSDNNILAAATAFANQKQYWADFVMLFNSNYLKQRRAGNQRGINEAELSAAVAGAQNKAKAAIAWLLQKGFLPTQIADSFAIASGGATFYRNRVNKLVKDGMTQEQAEKQAFLDFQQVTEVSQQSSRPDMISQQQASPLGRLILSFQNTPMQYARIMNKAVRDLANRRGDYKSHLSKIIYYGAIQSIIFGSLQSALFASIGDEDEESYEKKKERILNQMVDSWLVGIGVGGKAVSTLKNTIIEYRKQDEKDTDDNFMTKSDHAYTLLQLLGFSPPIGSKVRKIYSSIQSRKFNREVMKERGFTLDNPTWGVVGNVIEGLTNIPLGRLSTKLSNLDNALDSNNKTYQRIALLLGWNTWDLGIKDKDIETLKLRIKEQKKQEKELEKEEKKSSKYDVEVEKNKKKRDGICVAVTSTGTRCKNKAISGGFCSIHEEVEQREDGKKVRCKKRKSDGTFCQMKTSNKSGYCYYHD